MAARICRVFPRWRVVSPLTVRLGMRLSSTRKMPFCSKEPPSIRSRSTIPRSSSRKGRFCPRKSSSCCPRTVGWSHPWRATRRAPAGSFATAATTMAARTPKKPSGNTRFLPDIDGSLLLRDAAGRINPTLFSACPPAPLYTTRKAREPINRRVFTSRETPSIVRGKRCWSRWALRWRILVLPRTQAASSSQF